MTATTYLVDFTLSGSSTTGFHLTNTILHAAASARLRVGGGRGRGLTAGSDDGGALFALHPLHTEAVA